MGIPGRSNALLIASRLGLPDSILRRARELLGGEQRAVEGLLDDLEPEREILREQGRQVSAQQAQTSRMEEEYRDKLRELELYRERILAGAAQEAQELVSQARQRSHSLLRDFRTKIEKLENEKQQIVERCQLELDRLREQETSSSSSADRQEELSWEELERLTRPEVPTAKEPAPGELGLQLGQWPTVQRLISDWSAREQVSETPDNPLQVDAVDQQGRVAARTLEADLEVLKSAFQKHAPELPPEKAEAPGPDKSELREGSLVYSRRFGQEGELVKLKADKAEVKLGSVRMTVPLDDLELRSRPVSSEATISMMTLGMREVSSRVDLRGMIVDEAIYELGKSIDQAILAHLPKLEVIHGKGTGALRQGIQKFLASHPAVADYRLGEVYEGSYGVTVVNLKG